MSPRLPRLVLPLVASWLVLGCLAALPAQQRTPIKLVRDAALSPDGRTIVFSWRGDIWKVPSEGGSARRLTFHKDRDSQPRFSPDGRRIAFASRRTGSAQIHVMSADGSAPHRITSHTEGYELYEWTPDGQGFLVGATRDHWWRKAQRIFIQSLDGARAPKLLFDGYGDDATLDPDGTKLLFTREGTRTYRKHYHGSQESQVWQLDLASGRFTLLQGEGQGGCRWPLWTGDSEYVYVNQSTGTWNVFEGRVGASPPTQLTHFEDDGVLFPRISRDGSTVIFLRLFDLHRLDLDSGKDTQLDIWYDGDPTVDMTENVTQQRAEDVAFTDDGREIAFTSAGDLWVMDTVLKEPVRVADTPEEERDPVFSPDFKTLYFVSDAGGTTDVWQATKQDDKTGWWQQSAFKLEKLTNDAATERGPRIWQDGKQLAFIKGNGNLVSMDLKSHAVETLIASWNEPRYDFSPDWKWIAWSVDDDDYNSDVWIKPLDGSREPFNVSVHPDNDVSPRWSADGKILAWTGRRWGTETDIAYVYLTKEKDEETSRQRKLEKAIEKMKERDKKKKAGRRGRKPSEPGAKPKAPAADVVGTWKGACEGPEQMIPGGSIEITLEIEKGRGDSLAVAWTNAAGDSGSLEGKWDAKKRTLTLEGEIEGDTLRATARLTDGKLGGSWELVNAGVGGTWWAVREAPAEDAGHEAEEGGETGKKEQGKEEKKKQEPVRVDFEGLRDRIKRLAVPDSTERGLLWAPKEQKLYFEARVGGRSGVYSVEFPEKLTPKYWAPSKGRGARWLSDGKALATLERGVPATVAANGKSTSYTFSAKDMVDLAARNRVIFDMAWRTMRDRWYDPAMGNTDWDAIREKYRDVTATPDTEVLETAANMMLGELNGSHLGFNVFSGGRSFGRRRGAPRSTSGEWRPVTGHLGTRFDPDWKGPGLRVKDVVTGTPADRADSRIEAGEIILSIDGVEVGPELEIATVMTGQPDRNVRVHVRGKDGTERDVTLRPTTYGDVRRKLYDDWIKANDRKVEELSGGHLGYVHIQSMGGRNLLTFDADLYKIGHGKGGLVIDVRENGGGSITDHLLTCLCQPTHAITRSRGSGPGYPQDRRVYASWDKPIVVLCNQNSFSNAEIFSHAIKTLDRGQLVGVPTAGGVISTGGTFIMGMASLRLPSRGWYLLDGNDMELNGCVPQHVIWPEPGEMPAGKDRQLEKGVAVLQEEVAAWKARPRPKLKKATER